jgi:hypothetical protein
VRSHLAIGVAFVLSAMVLGVIVPPVVLAIFSPRGTPVTPQEVKLHWSDFERLMEAVRLLQWIGIALFAVGCLWVLAAVAAWLVDCLNRHRVVADPTAGPPAGGSAQG